MKNFITAVLTYHVVAATQFSSGLENGQQLETVQGGSLTISTEGKNY